MTAERLRLSLDELAAVAVAVGQTMPPGFRPGRTAAALADVAEALAERGLLLRDDDRSVIDPQLAGLLRLFESPELTAELRVHERDPAEAAPRRWITQLAVAGGRGVRLTRGRVLATRSPGPGSGPRDHDLVEVVGFVLPDTARQLAACIPSGGSPTAAGPVRSLWLTVQTSHGTFVDAWWDDGSGWLRAETSRDAGLRLSPVDRERLVADLAVLVAGGVV
jgi:hypothetical protein